MPQLQKDRALIAGVFAHALACDTCVDAVLICSLRIERRSAQIMITQCGNNKVQAISFSHCDDLLLTMSGEPAGAVSI